MTESNFELRINSLERRNTVLTGLVAISLLGTVLAATYAVHISNNATRDYADLKSQSVSIAAKDGIDRFIISSTVPTALVQGERIERNVPKDMAAMIFNGPKGEEVGGIGVSSRHTTVALDYRDTPIEAIGMATYQGKSGQSAMLKVMDNPQQKIDAKKLKAMDPDEVKKLQSLMVERISLGVEENIASLVIKDRKGNDRIILGVDAKDQAYIKVLNQDGSEVLKPLK